MAEIITTEYPDGTVFGVSISSDFVQENEGFYTIGSEMSISSVLSGYPGNISLSTIEVTILKPNGDTETDLYNAQVTEPFSFSLSEIGNYSYVVLLTNQETGEVYKQEGLIVSSDTIRFKYESCGVFSAENLGQEIKTVTYISLNEGASDTVSILPSEKKIISPSVGVTQVIVTENGEERIFLFNNSCEVEDCLARFIEDLLCGDEKACEMCPDETEVSQMMFFYNTYFHKVHELFYQNSFFEALDQTTLDKVSSINFVLGKIRDFCSIFNPDKDCSTCY